VSGQQGADLTQLGEDLFARKTFSGHEIARFAARWRLTLISNWDRRQGQKRQGRLIPRERLCVGLFRRPGDLGMTWIPGVLTAAHRLC
jgi:hypothetical protein